MPWSTPLTSRSEKKKKKESGEKDGVRVEVEGGSSGLLGRPIMDPRELSAHSSSDSTSSRPPTSSMPNLNDINDTYRHRADDYTINALSSFSFGNATSSGSSLSSPSPGPGPLDDDDDDAPPTTVDVTPRPSVVATGSGAIEHGHDYGYGHGGLRPSSRTTRAASSSSPPSSSNSSPRNDNFSVHHGGMYSTSNVSRHTFGTPSSASASVTSLSSNAVPSESATGHTSSASASDDARNASRSSPHRRHHVRDDVEFSSDDDFYDYSDEDDDGMRIEISSARFSVSRYSLGSGNGTGLTGAASGRRGSLPISIQSSLSSEDPNSYTHGHQREREREGSVATLRRPSRSLDDDVLLNAMQAASPIGTAEAGPMGSDADWRSFQGRVSSSPTKPQDPSSFPSQVNSSSTYTALASHGGMNPPVNDSSTPDRTNPGGAVAAEPEFDLAYITSFNDLASPTSVPDFVRRPSAISLSSPISPSSPRGSKNVLWSWSGFPLIGAGRRPSTATVMSTATSGSGGAMFMHDDSFAKGLLKWGGEGYKEQRKDWTFRRDTSYSTPPPAEPRGLSLGKGEKLKRTRSTSHSGARLSTTTAHTTSDVGEGTLSTRISSSGSASNSPSASPASGAASLSAYEDGFDKKEREKGKEKQREKGRLRRSPSNWRGMQVGSGEVWKNDLVGIFTVSREEVGRRGGQDSTKGPQQRLLIRDIRDRDPTARSERPPVIVHKHSKAMAFSLSRNYKPHPRASTFYSRPSNTPSAGTAAFSVPAPPPPPGRNPKGNKESRMAGTQQPRSTRIILLAPRKVQEAFTSTTTTRMLHDYGYLSSGGGDKHREREKERRRDRGHERDREKERDRDKEKKTSGSGDSKSSKARSRKKSSTNADAAKSESSATGLSSHGRDVVGTSSAPVYSNSASHSSASVTQESNPAEASSSSADPSSFSSRPPVRRRSRRPRYWDDYYDGYDQEDEDDDDDPDLDPPLPARTPHNETYGTINALERQHHVMQLTEGKSSSFKLFERFTSRSRTVGLDPSVAAMRAGGASFEPPWLTFPPRGKQEQQRRVVDNLNTSFKDVGLLPSTPREKSSRPGSSKVGGVGGQRNKRAGPTSSRKASASAAAYDVFENIPPESLYMLLPLWPGETDHFSQKDFPFKRPHVPIESRHFLLVCYKALEPQPAIDQQSGGKSSSDVVDTLVGNTSNAPSRKHNDNRSKTPRISPTSSSDSTKRNTAGDDRNILLQGFLITARLVSYHDLQGSGVRVPDEGLTINGPLEEAFREMPVPLGRTALSQGEHMMLDTIIGVCHSRESGVEFDPEALIALGLCRLLNPLPMGTVAEEYSEGGREFAPRLRLTPVGMAVMEMAWIGGLALTSFGPV